VSDYRLVRVKAIWSAPIRFERTTQQMLQIAQSLRSVLRRASRRRIKEPSRTAPNPVPSHLNQVAEGSLKLLKVDAIEAGAPDPARKIRLRSSSATAPTMIKVAPPSGPPTPIRLSSSNQ
jgi:hypothetical protein